MNNIFNAALKHLSAKNYSTTELTAILKKEFSSLPDVDELLQQTVARLEELRFCRKKLSSRIRSGFLDRNG